MTGADFTIAFGKVIRIRRAALGLSQEGLGDAAGIHATHVGVIERGQRSASLRVARGVALALGVELSVVVAEAERHTEDG